MYNLTQILEIVPACRTEAGWKLENIGAPTAAWSERIFVRTYTHAWMAERGVIKVVNFILARIWIRFCVCSPAQNDGTSENKVTSHCFKEQGGKEGGEGEGQPSHPDVREHGYYYAI